jgi:hypothetical protein
MLEEKLISCGRRLGLMNDTLVFIWYATGLALDKI